MLSTLRYLKPDTLDRFITSMDFLEESVAVFEQAASQADLGAMMNVAQGRHDACVFIRDTMVHHRLPPMALGSGRTSALYKLRALLRGLYMETQSVPLLQKVLEMVRGITTDMGTEASLSDVHGLTLRDVLPSHVLWGSMEVDGADRLASDQDMLSQKILPHALWVPGLGHIAHNLTQSVDQSLVHYKAWLEKLKALHCLLHHNSLRKRLHATCVQGQPFEWMGLYLQSGPPKLADWRWNSLLQALDVILPLQPLLQTVWNPQAFLIADQGPSSEAAGPNPASDPIASLSSNEFHVKQITEAIRSNSFWIYARMISKLNGVAASFESFMESCACHSWISSSSSVAQQLQQARLLLGLPTHDVDGIHHSPCPLAGLRALDLAKGVAQAHFQTTDATLLPSLLASSYAGATDADLQAAITDYHHGRLHMLAIVKQKFHLWSQPPWSLVLLGCSDVKEARSHAMSILTAFDASNAIEHGLQHAVHHQLSVKVLGVGSPLRSAIERFIAGERLDNLPDLRQLVHELRLLPTVLSRG